MAKTTEQKLLNRFASALGHSNEDEAWRDLVFRVLGYAHQSAVEKNAIYQANIGDPYYEWTESESRDEPFTLQEFVETYKVINEVANRKVSEENAFVERTSEEVAGFEITNDCGEQLSWMAASDLLDEDICALVEDQLPMSEQEYFDRHNEIYRIAHDKEYWLNKSNPFW